MPKKISRQKRGRLKPIETPGLSAESPIGLAIIHTDALLEGIRRRRIREVPNVPRWFARLTIDQRVRYQRCFRQTYLDMRIASGGLDEDYAFAYAHYSLDALRTACGFFASFVFDKAYEAQKSQLAKKKSRQKHPAKVVKKATTPKKAVTKKRAVESKKSAVITKKRVVAKAPVKKAVKRRKK
jgi:hypothetical protein